MEKAGQQCAIAVEAAFDVDRFEGVIDNRDEVCSLVELKHCGFCVCERLVLLNLNDMAYKFIAACIFCLL